MSNVAEEIPCFTGSKINLVLLLRIICTFLIQGRKLRWRMWFWNDCSFVLSICGPGLPHIFLGYVPLGLSSRCNTDPYLFPWLFGVSLHNEQVVFSTWEWNLKLSYFTVAVIFFFFKPLYKYKCRFCGMLNTPCWVLVMLKLKGILNTWCLPGFTKSGVISYMLFSCSLAAFFYHCSCV